MGMGVVPGNGFVRNLPIPASAPVLFRSTPLTVDGVGHRAEWTHTAMLLSSRSDGASPFEFS